LRFLDALGFLTIMPLPRRRAARPEELGRAITYFPVVGIIIGLILAGLGWLLGLILPAAVVSVLIVVALAVISGALHLDGLADTCDGIAGHKTVAARWQVMRDSRVGGFGIVGVALLLLVKYVSLNSVPGHFLLVTLVLVPLVSRWAMVYAIFAFPYARPSGLGKAFKQAANWRRFSLATALTLAAAMVLTGWGNGAYAYLAGLAIMAGSWLVVTAVAVYLRRRFAGLTGDTYGAINEVAEVSVLVLAGLLAHSQWLGLT